MGPLLFFREAYLSGLTSANQLQAEKKEQKNRPQITLMDTDGGNSIQEPEDRRQELTTKSAKGGTETGDFSQRRKGRKDEGWKIKGGIGWIRRIGGHG
jgi:hypothetical protein